MADQIDNRPVIPAVSNDTLIVAGIFRSLAEGEAVYDEALSKAIGRDACKGGRGVVRSAVRRVLREDDIHIIRLRSIGYKRATPPEALSAQSTGLDRIRREAGRRTKQIGKIDIRRLDREQTVKAMSMASMFGALSLMTHGRNVKKLETAVAQADEVQRISYNGTLALFQNGK